MTHVLGFCFDTDLNSGDIAAQTEAVERSGEYFRSAILASLFTNRRDPSQQLGGCWSDALYSDSFGSLLWTKQREKINAELLIELDQICRDALKWLVVEGRIQSLDVGVERAGAHAVMITITLHLNNGESYTQTATYLLQESA